MPKRKWTIEGCRTLARENSGECLSDEYINSRTKLKWKCREGHMFYSTPYHIMKNKHWCPKCSKIIGGMKGRVVNKETADELAKLHDGKCLSETFKTTKDKIKWECKLGHIFHAVYGNIKWKKSWCPECKTIKSKSRIEVQNEKKRIEIINKLESVANKNNGELLTNKNEYKDALSKMLWKCNVGHEFWSSWLQVGIMGQWCPHCYTKTQGKIYDILNNEFFCELEIKQNYRGFEWLINEQNNRLEVDIWIPSIKLAIEYDGEQHYKPIKFSSQMSDEEAKNNYKEVVKNDKIKNEKIRQHPEEVKYFIRINYKDRKKISKGFLFNKFIENGVKI